MAAADGTQDLESAHVVLAKTKLCNGSITAEFEHIEKGKLTYSHCQHTSGCQKVNGHSKLSMTMASIA